MKLRGKNIVLTATLQTLVTLCFGQVDTTFMKNRIGFSEYLSLVGKQNLSYTAEKFNVNIVEASIEMAKVFPDPAIYFGLFDNGDERMKMGYGASSALGYTIELGRKRRARIDFAKSQTELSRALLQNYFRNLRADATIGYLSAIKQKLFMEVLISSHTSMKGLARADSMRFKLGSFTEIDARQSKLEAGSMLNSLYREEGNWKATLLQLGMMLGLQKMDTLYLPAGDFSKFDRDFDLDALMIEAQNNRADLQAALRNKEVSQDALRLAKANRMIDLGLSFGASNTSYVINKIAPTPSFSAISAGITVPLKFSNKYMGQIKASEFSILQADVLYKQIELQIQTEVSTAFYNYQAAKKQVQQFNMGLLNEAKQVFEGKVYSYQRGETSLLEVLNAQRTYNETQLNYHQALYDYAAGLVELERATGIWDINF